VTERIQQGPVGWY